MPERGSEPLFYRPGPPRLAPGLCPGGMVIHVYDHAGVLLMSRMLNSHAEAQVTAESDADAVVEMVGKGADICMVIYDGDTGARQPANVLDSPANWQE